MQSRSHSVFVISLAESHFYLNRFMSHFVSAWLIQYSLYFTLSHSVFTSLIQSSSLILSHFVLSLSLKHISTCLHQSNFCLYTFLNCPYTTQFRLMTHPFSFSFLLSHWCLIQSFIFQSSLLFSRICSVLFHLLSHSPIQSSVSCLILSQVVLFLSRSPFLQTFQTTLLRLISYSLSLFFSYSLYSVFFLTSFRLTSYSVSM